MTDPSHATPSEVAAFVERMSADLAALSRSSGLDLLAYLLDIARDEAASAGMSGATLNRSEIRVRPDAAPAAPRARAPGE